VRTSIVNVDGNVFALARSLHGFKLCGQQV